MSQHNVILLSSEIFQLFFLFCILVTVVQLAGTFGVFVSIQDLAASGFPLSSISLVAFGLCSKESRLSAASRLISATEVFLAHTGAM